MTDRVTEAFAALENVDSPLMWGDVLVLSDDPLHRAVKIEPGSPARGGALPMDERPQVPVDAPRRRRWMLLAATALVVVAGAVVLTALLASPPRKQAGSGSASIPTMRIAKIYAEASAMNGEQHPDHVRATTASATSFCPPAVNCSHPRVFVVEGHGHFACQSCGGARPVQGRYLRVIINARTLRVSNYGALTNSNDLMTDHNSIRISPTKRPTPITRFDGTIQFTVIGQPSSSTSGGATLRVTDRYGVVLGEQYIPPHGLYQLRLPRADDNLFWFEAVGARPMCRIPLPAPGGQRLQFDVPCKGDPPHA